MPALPRIEEADPTKGMAMDVLGLLMGILGVPSVADMATCTSEWARAGSPQMAAKYARRTYELAARMHPRWWRDWQAESKSTSGPGRGLNEG